MDRGDLLAAVAATVLLIAAAIVYVFHKDDGGAPGPASRGGSASIAIANRRGPGSISEIFAKSHDYLEFANSVHRRAKDGDPDAQYYLGEALRYCAVGYRSYFNTRDGGRGKFRSLAEAVQRASERQPELSADEAREIYTRCHSLQEIGAGKFGTVMKWRDASAAAGQPLAQMDLAMDQLLQSGIMFSGDDVDVASLAARQKKLRDSSLELARKALRSKDPEVVWKMGDLQAALATSQEEAMRQQWLWRVAACQRGYDCGRTAAWYRFQCRFDTLCRSGESGLDLIRRATQSQFDAISQQAIQLNADVDAGRARIGFNARHPP